jgi:D-serine/D-alanine/glycine transporter
VLIYLVPNVVEAFTVVTTVAAVLFMCVWALILLSYLK